jgi:hypothetical protein
MNTWMQRIAAFGSLAVCMLGPSVANAEPPALTSARLAEMTWPELEQIYRQAQPGTVPEGYLRGRAIYCPCSKLAGVRSSVTNSLWHGKLFDSCTNTLVNQWSGFKAIKAQVSYGTSWLDGKQSIIMDYSGTSRIWKDVRDEAREVAPGVYLGLMYRRKGCESEFKLYFTLEPDDGKCACKPECASDHGASR